MVSGFPTRQAWFISSSATRINHSLGGERRRRFGAEEDVIERGLERLHFRFADPKARADLALIGAEDLDLVATNTREHCLHCVARQFRRVAGTTEMTEHDKINIPA